MIGCRPALLAACDAQAMSLARIDVLPVVRAVECSWFDLAAMESPRLDLAAMERSRFNLSSLELACAHYAVRGMTCALHLWFTSFPPNVLPVPYNSNLSSDRAIGPRISSAF